MLAAELEAHYDSQQEMMPEQSGPVVDIPGAAIGWIDWREIAESMLLICG